MSSEAGNLRKRSGNPFLMRLGSFLGAGALSKEHEQMNDLRYCFDCHNLFWGIPDKKCLKCHEILKKQEKEGTGMHRLWKKPCIECHSEHGGYSSEIFHVDHKLFPHEKTTFPLKGKHIKTPCEKCHKNPLRRSYFGLSTTCFSCHQKTPHQRIKNTECKACHTESSWKDMRKVQALNSLKHDAFNFKLLGKHKKVKCPKCHKKDQFTKMSYGKCLDCHQDPHKGQFKKRTCKSCHDTKEWKKTLFDHSKTKFPLVGFHARPMCKSCHPKKLFTGSDPACEGCHKDSYRFFAGFLPWNDEKHPDKMSRLLKCLDCHKVDDPLDNVALLRKRCVKCHNEHYGKLFGYWKDRIQEMFYGLIPSIVKLPSDERKKYNKRFIFLRKKYYHNLALSRLTIKRMDREMKKINRSRGE